MRPPLIVGPGIRIADTTSIVPAGVTGIPGVADTAQLLPVVFRHQFIRPDFVVGIVYPARLISHAIRWSPAIVVALTNRLVLSQVAEPMLR
ncbi:MAG: hypothetical protein P8M04_01760 [Akkermansiaceae bacterium]|nr:hypothetical protein [Akkermansiaceae bacterium]